MKAIADGREWIDRYVARKGPAMEGVAQGLRRLMKKIVPGIKESVNPWKVPTFASNGPMCFFMIAKNHVSFGFLRGTIAARSREAARRHRQKPAACEIAYNRAFAEARAEKTDPGRNAPE
jgi:hypothetical protein